MEKDNSEDVFKDFQHKVHSKKEIHHSAKEIEKETEHLSDEEILKRKYQKVEKSLKEKYEKEKQELKEKRNKELMGHEHPHSKNISLIERSAYIAVIVILLTVVSVDLIFYHGDDTTENTSDQEISAASADETDDASLEAGTVAKDSEDADLNTTEETTTEEETVSEQEPEEEVVLSGETSFNIDKIYTEVPDSDNDFGYIKKITFTIDNGKSKSFTPSVEVFIYDSIMDETWEETSRGKYQGRIIKPGEQQSGIIDIVPKSFINLDIKKSVRVTMKDEDDKLLWSETKSIFIT